MCRKFAEEDPAVRVGVDGIVATLKPGFGAVLKHD